jgi:dynein light intermediate chain
MMTRSDVVKHEEQLDLWLKEHKARDKEICPFRHSSLDALELHERGALLLNLRYELNFTIAAYNALDESAAWNEIRKAIHQEQDKLALKQMKDSVEAKIKQFDEKITDLTRRMEEAQRNDEQDNAAKEKEHVEKVGTLKAENGILWGKVAGGNR